MNEHPILNYFPHSDFREGQRETLLDIAYFYECNYKNICLEMPTGGGKSAIAFTVARWIAEQGINNLNDPDTDYAFDCPSINGKSYIITPQKILQDQYGQDIDNLILHEEMVVLKGKGNYKCILNPESKCDSCIKQAGKKCYLSDSCEYYRTEQHAIDSQTAVLNYHMLHVLDSKLYNKCFDDGLGKIDQDKYEHDYKRDLMVIDEAHNTESFLMDLISVGIRLNDEDDQKTYLTQSIHLDEVKVLLQASIEGLYKYQAELINNINNCGDNSILKMGKKLSAVTQKIKKLEYLELTLDNGNWSFVRDIRINQDTQRKYCHSIECKPIFVSSFAKSMIFRAARLKLFVSATLPDKEVFCRSLGLDDSATAYIKLPNNFPVENRKIYFMSNRSDFHAMNSKNIQLHGNIVVDDLVNVVNKIVNWEFHKGQKGLIITHTNAIMYNIMNSVQSREFIPCSGSIEQEEGEEQKDMRLEAIRNHCSSKNNSILIGPNLYEGLDLMGDKARFVILFKCPYPFEDEQVKARREKDFPWYYNNVGIKIIQGLGRGCRSKEDWVLNYLIDPGFDTFIWGRGGKYIPQYIKSAMVQMPKLFTNKEELPEEPDLPF